MEVAACDQAVENLLKQLHLSRHYAFKKKIIETGRPTPICHKSGESRKQTTALFTSVVYRTNPWLYCCKKRLCRVVGCLIYSTVLMTVVISVC